jgi:predicted kinase
MRRRPQGFVRRCHGDLHLRTVCLINGQPTLFDCIEFSDAVACIDVIYDLAFLVMDLLHRGLGRHAQVVYNEYVAATGDLDGLALLPLFLSALAAVRAKTSATAAKLESDATRRSRRCDEARSYLELALTLIAPPAPRLVAIGGLSGTGKSTLARQLAPGLGAAPGALVLRSDLIRKSLLGAHPLDRLGSEGYTEGMTRSVYRELADRATRATAAGRTVIVDAVFADPRDRSVIAEVATTLDVPFTGVWLEAPLDTRAARVAARRHDVSDATPAILREQLARDIGELSWPTLDAGLGGDALARAAGALLDRD